MEFSWSSVKCPNDCSASAWLDADFNLVSKDYITHGPRDSVKCNRTLPSWERNHRSLNVEAPLPLLLHIKYLCLCAWIELVENFAVDVFLGESIIKWHTHWIFLDIQSVYHFIWNLWIHWWESCDRFSICKHYHVQHQHKFISWLNRWRTIPVLRYTANIYSSPSASFYICQLSKLWAYERWDLQQYCWTPLLNDCTMWIWQYTWNAVYFHISCFTVEQIGL